MYPKNISENDIRHNLVPKKGLKPKFTMKQKVKKHAQHIYVEKYKKKRKYVKEIYSSKHNEVTEEPYNGGTYMQVKYVNANEINWGDTNTYPSFTGTDSFIHIDDEETMKR